MYLSDRVSQISKLLICCRLELIGKSVSSQFLESFGLVSFRSEQHPLRVKTSPSPPKPDEILLESQRERFSTLDLAKTTSSPVYRFPSSPQPIHLATPSSRSHFSTSLVYRVFFVLDISPIHFSLVECIHFFFSLPLTHGRVESCTSEFGRYNPPGSQCSREWMTQETSENQVPMKGSTLLSSSFASSVPFMPFAPFTPFEPGSVVEEVAGGLRSSCDRGSVVSIQILIVLS